MSHRRGALKLATTSVTDRTIGTSPWKPGYMPGFLLLALLTACGENSPPGDTSTEPERQAGIAAQMRIAGELDNEDIDEASGIAHSRRVPDLLWTHNDSGSRARLYAIDGTGRQVGRIRLEGADNVDWEDLATSGSGDTAILVAADIGDNQARRNRVSLYVIREPDLSIDDKPEIEPLRRIDFRYPEGPRDAEGLAIDGDRALILTKRDLPPVLYAVDLDPEESGVIEAELLGPVVTLPAPNQLDREFAPRSNNWHWQPTAMDIAPDGSAIVILTYAAVYYYRRSPGEDWYEALRQPPLGYPLGNVRNAEAVSFCADGMSIFITVEYRNAPLYRIDLLEAP